MTKVITVGEILVEMMAKQIGQPFDQAGEFLGPYPSGAPAIFIDQVAKMGVECGIVSRIGQDAFGKLNVQRLSRDGVDTSRVLDTPGYTTGTAFVTYDPHGSRSFIFHFAHSAAGMLSPEDIDAAYIRQASYLHVMGCTLSVNSGVREAVLKAVEIAKENGAVVSFDPNIRPELLQMESVRDVFGAILKHTDVLLSGEMEFQRLAGKGTPADVSEYTSTIPLVILKNGAKGCTLYRRGKSFRIPSFAADEVDPTGAGDCFDGAFIASLCLGMDAMEAAEVASAAGALGVAKMGPMEGTSTQMEIQSFMASARRNG